MKPCFSTAATWLLALVPLGPVGGAESSAPSAEIVDLPPFEIKGTFPWTYASAPGYEVLSLARDRETRSTMERFLRAIRVAPVFFPSGWEAEYSEPIVLFLHHFDGESTLAAVQQANRYSFMPDNISVTQGGVMVSLPGRRLMQNWMRSRQSPLADHVAWMLALQPQAVPPWYQKGLHGLLASSSLTGTVVDLPGIRWSNDELMPLADVLAIASRHDLAELERGPRELRDQFIAGAMLFVRWGFFAEDGLRRAALFSLVDAASRSPLTEESFAGVFGLSLDEAQSDLTAYAHGAAQQRVSTMVPGNRLAEVPRRAEVEPATRPQVARLLGRFYFLLGVVSFPNQREQYFEKARTAFLEAFPQGEEDARLVSDLGLLEHFEGNQAAAAPRLEAALDDAVTDSRPLLALARLRLKNATAEMEEDEVLDDEQFESIMVPLRKAMQLQPVSQDACLITIALWLNRRTLPSEQELAALERGARTYFHVPQIIIPIIQLHKRAQRPDVASELIALLLQLPTLTEDARSALLEEQAALHGSNHAP